MIYRTHWHGLLIIDAFGKLEAKRETVLLRHKLSPTLVGPEVGIALIAGDDDLPAKIHKLWRGTYEVPITLRVDGQNQGQIFHRLREHADRLLDRAPRVGGISWEFFPYLVNDGDIAWEDVPLSNLELIPEDELAYAG